MDFTYAGERYRKRSPLDTRTGAEQYEATLRSRLVRGEPLDPPPSPKEAPKLSEFAAHWLDTYVRANNKPSEQWSKENVLRVHLNPTLGKRRLDTIGLQDIESYKVAKLKSGLAPKSINNHLAVISALLRAAFESDLIDKMPRIKWLRVEPKEPRFLEPPQLARFLSYTEEPLWHLMVLVAVRTGMRLGELLALEWPDVDLQKRIVAVRRSVKRGVTTSPKSNRFRYIPLTSDAWDALGNIAQPSGYVFTRNGSRLTDGQATCAIRRMSRRTGLQPIGWHTLRHTFASQLVAGGAPLPAVQALLGHSSITMTLRYVHLAPSTLVEAVSLLDPASKHRSLATGGQQQPFFLDAAGFFRSS